MRWCVSRNLRLSRIVNFLPSIVVRGKLTGNHLNHISSRTSVLNTCSIYLNKEYVCEPFLI